MTPYSLVVKAPVWKEENRICEKEEGGYCTYNREQNLANTKEYSIHTYSLELASKLLLRSSSKVTLLACSQCLLHLLMSTLQLLKFNKTILTSVTFKSYTPNLKVQPNNHFCMHTPKSSAEHSPQRCKTSSLNKVAKCPNAMHCKLIYCKYEIAKKPSKDRYKRDIQTEKDFCSPQNAMFHQCSNYPPVAKITTLHYDVNTEAISSCVEVDEEKEDKNKKKRRKKKKKKKKKMRWRKREKKKKKKKMRWRKREKKKKGQQIKRNKFFKFDFDGIMANINLVTEQCALLARLYFDIKLLEERRRYCKYWMDRVSFLIAQQQSSRKEKPVQGNFSFATIFKPTISGPMMCENSSGKQKKAYRSLLLGRTSNGCDISIGLRGRSDSGSWLMLLIKLPLAMGEPVQTRESEGRRPRRVLGQCGWGYRSGKRLLRAQKTRTARVHRLGISVAGLNNCEDAMPGKRTTWDPMKMKGAIVVGPVTSIAQIQLEGLIILKEN
ncbi:hypothetical protein C0J52_11859 [Blattella germanica]|nr:hypothetical protein C0J52_11859 [Blattella germanica]